MKTRKKAHKGIFKAADLIFRIETSPKRSSNHSSPISDLRRHIRDPKDFESVYTDQRPRTQVAQLAGTTTSQFRFDGQIKVLETSGGSRGARSITPCFQRSATGKEFCESSSPVKGGRRRGHEIRENMFRRLLTACCNIPPCSSLEVSTDKARIEETLALKNWRQAQERVRKMREYDPDLLVPLYVLEKGADVFNESEVISTARSRKSGCSPLQRLLKPTRKPVHL